MARAESSTALGRQLGLVINPRGTSGAGKTWLVREVMTTYRRVGSQPTPIMRANRIRPIGWRLDHPSGGRTLSVIGDYGTSRGGLDTIPLRDGGMEEAFRLASAAASDGDDVLLEGYQLCGEHDRTVALAKAQRARGKGLHVLCLNVPLSQCVQNVVARRRAGYTARPAIERTARAGQDALTHACELLHRSGVVTEWLDPLAALYRTLSLLGLRAAIDVVEAQPRPSTKIAQRG